MYPNIRYLPFHQEQAQVEEDPERHGIHYSLVAPVLDFAPRPSTRFRAEWVAARSGSVTLLAGSASPVICQLGDQPSQAMLHLPFHGEGRYQVDKKTLVSRAGHSMVYMPGVPHRAESDHCAGLTFNLNPQRLALCAAAMAQKPDCPELFMPRFIQPLQLDQSDRLVSLLSGHLQRIVDLIDLLPTRTFDLPASLPLERYIEKAVAALVIPALVGGRGRE